MNNKWTEELMLKNQQIHPNNFPLKELPISPKITEASVQSFILLEVQDGHLFLADFLTESQGWSLFVPCLLFWAALVAASGHGFKARMEGSV